MSTSTSITEGTGGTRQQILDTARSLIVGKGFTAVGLSEILTTAGVPRGSFYHWFGSKEQFGEALLQRYFDLYLQQVNAVLADTSRPARARLLDFFGQWQHQQTAGGTEARCLVVKLSAEVCDLSEPMRLALDQGTAQVVASLVRCLADGLAGGEFTPPMNPVQKAESLYQRWLGATLLARVRRSSAPLDQALADTQDWLTSQPDTRSVTGPGARTTKTIPS